MVDEVKNAMQDYILAKIGEYVKDSPKNMYQLGHMDAFIEVAKSIGLEKDDRVCRADSLSEYFSVHMDG